MKNLEIRYNKWPFHPEILIQHDVWIFHLVAIYS